jgi:type II secretory pathway component GspD/PulD (secretin)
LTFTNCLLNAQSSDQKLRITYNNNLINISAEDADLQNVLFKIADNTNIYVRFPATLEKKITISLKKNSVRDALKTILKGLNYAIIYSGSDKNQTFISKVFVFKKSRKSRQQRANEVRIANRMRAYEKQIESLKKNLLKIDESSNRGKRYLRRIRIFEKRMERLQGQYN